MGYSDSLWELILHLLEKNNEKRKSLADLIEFIHTKGKKTDNLFGKKQVETEPRVKESHEIIYSAKTEMKTEQIPLNEDFKKQKELINQLGSPEGEIIMNEKTRKKTESNNEDLPCVVAQKLEENALKLSSNREKANEFILEKPSLSSNQKNIDKITQKDSEKEQEKKAQKFKIRPFSANVMISNKIRENGIKNQNY